MDFFNLHTHKGTDRAEVLELVNQYPQEFNRDIPFYSIGIHPWYINEESLEVDLVIIESKLQNENCLAIGECGLDKRIDAPFELQQMVFERQLLLAQKYSKPVVIHCVAAFQEVIEIKKRLNISVPLIIHGFSKNQQIATQLIGSGFYLSFGKYLVQSASLGTGLEEVFKKIPENHIFLETDTIDKGIETVYELASNIKGISMTEMQEIIKRNFETVFKRK